MTICEYALGNSGKENPYLIGKKQLKLDSGRGSLLPLPVGSEGNKKQDKTIGESRV